MKDEIQYLYLLTCDHAMFDHKGKLSAIGIFTEVYNKVTSPFIFYVVGAFKTKLKPRVIKIIVTDPNGTEVDSKELKFLLPSTEKNRDEGINFSTKISCSIDIKGIYKIHIFFDGKSLEEVISDFNSTFTVV